MSKTFETTEAAAPSKRRRRPFRAFLITVLGLLALIAAAVLVLVAINALDNREAASFLPPKPDAYASVRSLSELATRLTGLKAADELLSGPGEAELRSLLVAARSTPLLSSKLFRFLANVPVHIAVEGDRVIAAVDLGLAGTAARLLPLASPFIKVKELSYEYSKGVSRILVGKAPSFVRLAVVGRILLVSTSAQELEKAIARGTARTSDLSMEADEAPNLALRARLSGLDLSAPREGAIRIIADISGLTSRLGGSGVFSSGLFKNFSFPREAVLDLDISDESVSLEASLPVSSSDKDLAALLTRRSGVPSVLPLLPASSVYASIAAIERPGSLMQIALRYFDKAGANSYASADSACTMALGIGFDKLLFSWAGDEFGVFGLEKFPEPVFFMRVSNETARKAAFDKLVSSAFFNEDLSTVVEDLRIPRLVLPSFVRDILKLVDVDIPQPYWIVERGFLFASSSAEALRAVAKSISSGETLMRSEGYRNLIGSSGSDSSFAIFYSLDRGDPFFLRGSSPIERVLRLYKNGVLFIRSGSSALGVSLHAVRGKESAGLRELPGFPVTAGGRLVGAPLVLGSGSKAVAVLPLSGARLVAKPLSGGSGGGSTIEAKLDGDAWLCAAVDEKGMPFVWALTKQGTVYRLDSKLEHIRPFPIAASLRPSSPPALAPVSGAAPRLVFGVKGGGFLLVSADGTERKIELPGEPALLSPPAFAGGMFAVYPKSFDGRILLVNENGETMAGWPVEAGGIAFGSPVFVRSGSDRLVAFLTQAGELTLRSIDGTMLSGFPLRLGGSYSAAPVAQSKGSSLYMIDSEGLITRVSTQGEVIAERREEGLKGGEVALAIASPYADDRELVFAAGSGNGLYAFTSDLDPVPGFPAKAAWLPALADIDGDGKVEIVTGGIDDTIHAYAIR
jgi:hypothetical protein